MSKKEKKLRSKYVVELKYKKGGKEVHTVYAVDKMEAFEWGEKQVEELGHSAKISVFDEVKD